MFLLCVAVGTTATAQDLISIAGAVTTRADGLSMPGAVVSVVGSTATTTTDTSGRYTLQVPRSVVRDGQIQLKVDAPGLPPSLTAIAVNAASVTADVALSLGFAENITVGSRIAGAEAEKAVPVDVITPDQIASSGYAETAQVIQSLAASFNFPRPTITDGTDTVRPATLRGLGPDQVLVLVNGKRRHQSALVHLNGSIGRGSTGVDLNAIPVSAIDHIEVLRDGAAAQYGSDAIAGVINIVLKGGGSRPNLTTKFGLSRGAFIGNRCASSGLNCTQGDDIDFSDGELADVGGSWGIGLGKGSVTVAAEYRHHNRTNRASFDPRDQIVAGDAGNNPVAEPNHRWGDPDTRDTMTYVNASVPLNRAQTRFLYGFGGYSRRQANSAGFYRRALDVRNWPQIYPLGFLPVIQPTVVDASGTAGVRGAFDKWTYDISGQYGRNSFAFTIGDSLNVSLGPSLPPNKTTFEAGTLTLNQFVGNVDVSRPVRVGHFAGPLNVAIGAEYRRENYQIVAGEPDSYRDGGVPNRAGGPAAIGAQVFPGFRPSNEVDESRSSVAGYVDVEGDVLNWLRLGAAARTEHYSDFGSTVDGKITVRVRADRRFIVRSSLSTGFRAPSLGQSFFSSTATNFLNLGQGLVPVESLTLPVSSAAAQTLGAQPLEPERSTAHERGRGDCAGIRPGHHRRLLPHRHRRPHRPVGELHRGADCGAACAVRRQQRALLHECDRYANQRSGRDGELSAGAAGGGRLAAARRLQQHALEGRRRRCHAAAAGRLRVGAVRSHRTAPHRMRSAERQPAARRRLAPHPIRRERRRRAIRRVLQLYAEPRRRPDLPREVADRRRSVVSARRVHAGDRRAESVQCASRAAIRRSIRSTESRRSRATRRSG